MFMKYETLPVATVSQIKAELAQGQKQTDIADRWQLSQPTISNIRAGRRYKDVPWPNGKIGSVKDAYGTNRPGVSGWGDKIVNNPLAANEWSESALQYMQWPEICQHAMLGTVNSARVERGEFELASVSPEWALYMNHKGDDPDGEHERRAIALDCENTRRTMIFDEFTQIVETNRAAQRNAHIDEIATANLPPPTERSEAANTPINDEVLDPTEYETLTVGAIKVRDPQHPIAAQAIRDSDAALLEAVCIVLFQLPTGQWREPSVIRSIFAVKEMVLLSIGATKAARVRLAACSTATS